MSSQIYYDRAFISVGEQFIPIVNSGSSNCFDFDIRGREIPEKHWEIASYPFRNKLLFSAEEMREVAAAYEEINAGNRGGIRKSRYRPFEVGEFGRWILGGIRSAHTVEEYRRYGNTVVIILEDVDHWKRIPVRSTEELIEKLDSLSDHDITVSFDDDRHVKHPPIRPKGKAFNYSKVSEFYVLRAESGYYIKRSKYRIWFTRCENPHEVSVRKFRTEREAQKYLADNRAFFVRFPMEVERVSNKEISA